MTNDHELAQRGRDHVQARTGAYAPSLPGSSAAHPQVLLFGNFGCGNFGNDGSLETMLRFLERARPDAACKVICSDPDVVAGALGVDAYPIRWSSRRRPGGRFADLLMKLPRRLVDIAQVFRLVRRADVVVIPGTGILDDFGERPAGMPLDIFAWCLIARLLGAKVAMVCIGAGPIRNSLSRKLMIGAARLANYRSYRDLTSRDFMMRSGFDALADPIFPDIVFNLPVPAIPPNSAATGVPVTVAVGVMAYRGWYNYAAGGDEIFERYIGKLAEFVAYLLAKGHRVRLLTGELGDSAAVAALLQKLHTRNPRANDELISAEPSHSLHDLMIQMAGADLVVATRFHNIVCALKMAKPSISLGYAKKNDVLMADMGLGEYCQHIESFDPHLLIEQFERLARHREAYVADIRERVAAYQRQLGEQETFLLASLV